MHIEDALDQGHPTTQAANLRTIQGLTAPLTIAAQCATSIEEIQQLRETMAQILAHLDSTATAIEQEEN